MNPDSLLDLAFGGEATSNDQLPAADYLPALAKQRELEALLAQQQVCICISRWNLHYLCVRLDNLCTNVY